LCSKHSEGSSDPGRCFCDLGPAQNSSCRSPLHPAHKKPSQPLSLPASLTSHLSLLQPTQPTAHITRLLFVSLALLAWSFLLVSWLNSSSPSTHRHGGSQGSKVVLLKVWSLSRVCLQTNCNNTNNCWSYFVPVESSNH
jgi:hypothetical protein